MGDLPRATKFATSRVWYDTFHRPPLSGLPFSGSATGTLGLLGRRKGEKQAEEEEGKEEEEEEEEKGEAGKMDICITQTL